METDSDRMVRRSYYNPSTHGGTQPVRVLQYNIIDSFEKASPGFRDELRSVVTQKGLPRGIKYHVNEQPILRSGGRAQTPCVSTDRGIELHETFLSYVWTICYSLLVLFDELIQKRMIQKAYNRTFEYSPKTVREAFCLFHYGISLIKQFRVWDKGTLPNPEEYDENEADYVEKANGVFVHAMVFILCHEFAHVRCGHTEAANRNGDVSPDLEKIHEYRADELATTIVLAGAEDESRRSTAGFGLIAGLSADLFLGSVVKSETHPDKDDRIRNALEKLNLGEKDNLWGIACLAFKLWDESYRTRLKWPTEVETYKDLFYCVVSQLAGQTRAI